MTCDEQLKLWLSGKPVHNKDRDECCPDLSCCQPELLACLEEREHFVAADSNERDRMLMMFLGRAMAAMSDAKVYVCGPERTLT